MSERYLNPCPEELVIAKWLPIPSQGDTFKINVFKSFCGINFSDAENGLVQLITINSCHNKLKEN